MKKERLVGKEYLIPFSLLVFCFAFWGLLNNMTDNLVPAFGRIFMIKAVNSSLVQVAFYGAYAVLAIPSALIIRKFNYRAGVLVGLGLYIIGALCYIPSALIQNYNLFLFSIFTLAGGLSMLETTCNPFVLSMGKKETAVRRLNFAQQFNPIGSLVGILLAKFLILGHLNPATVEERTAMDAAQLSSIRATELWWVCVPYVGLTVFAAIIWIFFFKKKFDEKDEGPNLNIAQTVKKLITLPRYAFGVVTQFFYVGMQIAVWTWTIKYAMTNFSILEDNASTYYLISIIMFIIFRIICTQLMKVFRPVRIMTAFAIAGIVFCLGTIYLPSNISIWCLVSISIAMSLMFPTIYGVALNNLGPEVKLGAAGLIMAILGGAVITPFMGSLIDNGTLNFLTPGFEFAQASIRSSFFIPVICFAVILVYSICFRNSNATAGKD